MGKKLAIVLVILGVLALAFAGFEMNLASENQRTIDEDQEAAELLGIEDNPVYLEQKEENQKLADNQFTMGIIALVLGIVFLLVGILLIMKGKKAEAAQAPAEPEEPQ